MAELGGIDILVNDAGKQQNVPDIADLPSAQFEETFRTNVFAMFWLCKAALARVPAGATIINTSSVESYSPSPILLDYATTKAAINAFSKALPSRSRRGGSG